MAQITSISINDGQTTPVAHVFNPVQSVPPMFRRNGVSGQAVIAQERLLIKTLLANTTKGVNKVQLEMVIPVVEVPAGGAATGYVAPPAVAHEQRVKIEFFLHQRSEKLGRKDLRIMAANLLLNSLVASAIDDLEQPY